MDVAMIKKKECQEGKCLSGPVRLRLVLPFICRCSETGNTSRSHHDSSPHPMGIPKTGSCQDRSDRL